MNSDDGRQRGHHTRRDALAWLGAAGVGALTGFRWGSAAAAPAARPQCVVRPEQTEGPFFLERALQRGDIRTDPATGRIYEGVPLHVAFRISRVRDDCTPLVGAIVDLWHCDAAGTYSGVRDWSGSTVGQQFLRGYQITDSNGVVRFTTIYPGWYRGRTVHLHFKVRTRPVRGAGEEFTSQVYFDDALTDRVFRQEPYARRGRRDVRNEQDGLFARGGRQLLLDVEESREGLAGLFDLGLRPA